jgi:hypothetical protein
MDDHILEKALNVNKVDVNSPVQEGRIRVMLAVPSRNVWMSQTAMSFAAMVAASVSELPFLDVVFNNCVATGLSMSRSKMVKDAIKANCNYIFFIDDDMNIPMHALILLLCRKKDIVAANCARKELPPRTTAKGFDGNCVDTKKNSKGLEEVLSVGTGMMLIKCDIFQNLPQPWFMEDPVAEIGEDVYFCKKAREHGYNIYIDHDLSKDVGHIGEFEFSHKIRDVWNVD